jgi:hypothetical protein
MTVNNVLYCPRQFTWRLHSEAVILVRLVTARFKQRDGSAGIHRSDNIMRGGVRPIVTRARCSYCVSTEKRYFWTVVLSRACAKPVILTSEVVGKILKVTYES